jgi:hypothetical protein
MKYYIINVGKNMDVFAKICGSAISASNSSYIMYYHYDNDLMTIEEVDIDIFMNHHIIAQGQYNNN